MGGGVVLYGREREVEIVGRLVADVPRRGGALLVSGEPGVGKSALLDRCAEIAREAGHRVVRAAGTESEAVLPYAVLADVMLPLRGHFAALPGRQRRALGSGLALSDEVEAEPFSVCAAALGVLSAAGGSRPLVVLVDDVHWADASSRQALEFAARRVGDERVLLILACRANGLGEGGEVSAAGGIPRLVLGGIDEEAARGLLAGCGMDPLGAVASRLVRVSCGNPLVLVEYAASGRAADGDPPGNVPPGRPGPLVRRAWGPLLAGLPARTAEALVYVAAAREGEPGLVDRALGAVGLSPAVLEPAERNGLLLPGPGGGHRLRHPVLRSLVLDLCPRGRLLGVYRVLARHAREESRAWYRAAGAPGRDEAIARSLAEAARRARDRGAPGAAARAWHRAAEMSPSPADRAVRLLHAGREALRSGSSSDALEWCELGLRAAEDPLLAADHELLRGEARTWLGAPGAAHRALAAAAVAVAAVDPGRACVLSGVATLPAAMDGRTALAVELAERCVALAEAGGARSGGEAARRLRFAHVLLGSARMLEGRGPEGRELLLEHLEELDTRWDGGDGDLETGQLLIQVGEGLSWAEEDEAALSLLDRVVDGIRHRGTPGLLPYALSARCAAESWTRWPAARADAQEAFRWAVELGNRTMVCYAQVLLAGIASRAGDLTACQGHLAEYRRGSGDAALPGLDVLAAGALGAAVLAADGPGRAREPLEEAHRLTARAGIGNPNMLTFVADLAEARLRDGDRAGAEEIARRLEDKAASARLAWPRAAAARVRVLLAEDPEEATRWWDLAEEAHTRRDMPYERARALLGYGQALRRMRRHSAAETPLLAAQRAFAGLGARTWSRRAENELAAAGRRAAGRPSAPPRLDRLTAQELQTARTVADGLNNQETADLLFISRKTVEAHLTKIYQKLSIRSRSDLARLLARAEQT